MIGCLTSLIKHLWKFLTRHLLKIIKISTHSSLIKFSIKETELEYLNRDLIRNLSKISNHQFLSIIIRFYSYSSYSNTSMYAIFQLLGLTILNLRRFEIDKYQEQLLRFYLKAFDIRISGVVKNTDSIEQSMIHSFLNLVVKLKKIELKKICKRMIEWIGIPIDISYYSRSMMFFKFLLTSIKKFKV
jgi:hypothetical protein